MSMNQYMHPRNIYKKPQNFKELAIEFPEFRKYVKQVSHINCLFNLLNFCSDLYYRISQEK